MLHQHEEQLLLSGEPQLDQIQGLVTADQDEAPHDGGCDVVGVVAGNLLLRLQGSEDQVLNAQFVAEDLVDSNGDGGGGGGTGSQPASQREALLKGEGEAHGADAEHLHDLDGGDPSTVLERVFAELAGVVARNVGDGYLAGVNMWVHCEGHCVAKPVHDAPEEVEVEVTAGAVLK